ncbi:MAG: peptidylprolyl isomerase, partial [bacterium]
MLSKITLFFLLLLILVSSGWSKREVVDKIVAVVGDKVILASEVATQTQMMAMQMQKKPSTEKEVEELQKQVIEQMVSDQLLLLAAEQDTSIKIRPEEVDQALDEQIARVAQNFPSNDAFLEALSAEGLTLRDLKKKFRTDIEGQLLKQRLIGSRVQSVSVSRHEVEVFYDKYKDSIPSQPEAVKLAHILLDIKPSEKIEDSIKAIAQDLRKRILDGEDFAAIATQYSDMGAGVNGGDLGFISREDVVPEFARAAFNLSVGDISGVIRTPFGYHVIKC